MVARVADSPSKRIIPPPLMKAVPDAFFSSPGEKGEFPFYNSHLILHLGNVAHGNLYRELDHLRNVAPVERQNYGAFESWFRDTHPGHYEIICTATSELATKLDAVLDLRNPDSFLFIELPSIVPAEVITGLTQALENTEFLEWVEATTQLPLFDLCANHIEGFRYNPQLGNTIRSLDAQHSHTQLLNQILEDMQAYNLYATLHLDRYEWKGEHGALPSDKREVLSVIASIGARYDLLCLNSADATVQDAIHRVKSHREAHGLNLMNFQRQGADVRGDLAVITNAVLESRADLHLVEVKTRFTYQFSEARADLLYDVGHELAALHQFASSMSRQNSETSGSTVFRSLVKALRNGHVQAHVAEMYLDYLDVAEDARGRTLWFPLELYPDDPAHYATRVSTLSSDEALQAALTASNKAIRSIV